MKIAYYLNDGRKKNLYCRISDGTERVSFSLGHTINPEKWNGMKEEGPEEDPYYYTLQNFKEYLSTKYHDLKSEGKNNVLAILKNEAESFIDGTGIEGIARSMFDVENQGYGLPRYDQFIQAFEKYSNLQKGEYKTMALGSLIHFYTKNEEVYEMDTYAGLTARLKSFIERRSYLEIITMTEVSYWCEICDDAISKHIFIPKMLKEWEIYWNNEYEEIKQEGGKTDHLDKFKEHSWRCFQTFIGCYNESVNVIEFAYNMDDSILYPLAVITMLSVWDAEACYEEYCESELEGNEKWESVTLGEESEDNDDSHIFHIRLADEFM